MIDITLQLMKNSQAEYCSKM